MGIESHFMDQAISLVQKTLVFTLSILTKLCLFQLGSLLTLIQPLASPTTCPLHRKWFLIDSGQRWLHSCLLTCPPGSTLPVLPAQVLAVTWQLHLWNSELWLRASPRTGHPLHKSTRSYSHWDNGPLAPLQPVAHQPVANSTQLVDKCTQMSHQTCSKFSVAENSFFSQPETLRYPIMVPQRNRKQALSTRQRMDLGSLAY